jgi:hypothetical protein
VNAIEKRPSFSGKWKFPEITNESHIFSVLIIHPFDAILNQKMLNYSNINNTLKAFRRNFHKIGKELI